MLDQATELRKLVLRSAREISSDGSPPPQRLVICGAAPGVGVTTLAVNLAVAFSGQGCRVVLVDADLQRADVAALCGLGPSAGITDVLAARRDIHEVLQPGPGGVQVIAGRDGAGHPADWGEVAQQRLVRQLSRLGRHADLIVLDAGSGTHDVMRRLWREANQVVLVATAEALSRLESCAALQRWVCRDARFRCGCWSTGSLTSASRSKCNAASWTLSDDLRGWNLDLLGLIPNDPALESAKSPAAAPTWLQEGPLMRALDAAAARLLAEQRRPVSVSRSQTRGPADCLNSADLAQPQPVFSPIDI